MAKTKPDPKTYARFAEFVKEKDVVIAEKIGVSPQTVSNWKTRGIANDKIIPLANIYGLDASYIMTGERSTQNQVNNQNGYIGGSVSQSVVNNCTKLANDDEWFFVADNAMSPTFGVGDRVRIDTEQDVVAGNYVLVECNGLQTLRKYRPKGYDENGKPYTHLVAENEDYPIIDDRYQAFAIIGVAVEFKRKLV